MKQIWCAQSFDFNGAVDGNTGNIDPKARFVMDQGNLKRLARVPS